MSKSRGLFGYNSNDSTTSFLCVLEKKREKKISRPCSVRECVCVCVNGGLMLDVVNHVALFSGPAGKRQGVPVNRADSVKERDRKKNPFFSVEDPQKRSRHSKVKCSHILFRWNFYWAALSPSFPCRCLGNNLVARLCVWLDDLFRWMATPRTVNTSS